MSVTSVELSRNGSTGGHGKSNRREFSATYLVTTDDPLDQADTVCKHFQNAGNLPYVGSPYEYANDREPAAVCVGIDPRLQDGSRTSWIVTLKYETPTSEKEENDNRREPDGNGNLTEDPTRWLEKWHMSFHQWEIPVEKAIYRSGFTGFAAMFLRPGVEIPIVNSAFVVMDPPAMKEFDIMVWRRQFYARSYSSDLAELYQGKVNSNAINIVRPELSLTLSAPAECLRVKNVGATLEYINNFVVWNWQMEFHINPMSWRYSVVDRGFSAFTFNGTDDGQGGQWSSNDAVAGRAPVAPILDFKGEPTREPVLLDGGGRPLITVAGIRPPVYLVYSLYPEVEIPDSLFGA